MNKTRLIYLSNQLTQTVMDSQVLNWLELIGEKGVMSSLIIITPLSYLFKENSTRKRKLDAARSAVPGKVKQVFIPRANDRIGLSGFIVALCLLIILFPYWLYQKKKVIIQTRITSYSRILNFVKHIYSNVHIIFDYRGAGAEEFLNNLGFDKISEVDNVEISIEYQRRLKSEIQMVGISDSVFCVSNKLKQYALSNLNEAGRQDVKITVVPGAADQNMFYVADQTRKRIREKYDVGNKCVLIYTGKLTAKWHKREAIFKLVSVLMDDDEDFFFMCITPDLKLAEKLALEYSLDSSKILIKFSEYKGIPNFLNAADLGIILRDDIMTNRVASPTKVPEYLLTGLPIIISRNIGDYSDFIFEHNLGIVIDDDQDLYLLKNKLKILQFDRHLISKISQEKYSKQSQLDKIYESYRNYLD